MLESSSKNLKASFLLWYFLNTNSNISSTYKMSGTILASSKKISIDVRSWVLALMIDSIVW